MKIEFDMIRKFLDEARDESLLPVDDSNLMKDYGDKMFNFGVQRMFHEVLMKLFDAEEIARRVG